MFSLAHPRFRHVEPGVFTRRVVADCMSHRCTLVASHREKLDACCQYGVDVTESERANIERRAPEIRALLRVDGPWFGTDIELDPDTGPLVRTRVVNDGCIFLAHDRRGCAIHRASIENDWDYRGTKPHVCRLFPLTYTHDAIVISDDYVDYSCAYDASAPTLYRVARDALADIFGPELVAAMDAVEAKRLPVVTASGRPADPDSNRR
jgi:Fe-S-cluster containining protein